MFSPVEYIHLLLGITGVPFPSTALASDDVYTVALPLCPHKLQHRMPRAAFSCRGDLSNRPCHINNVAPAYQHKIVEVVMIESQLEKTTLRINGYSDGSQTLKI